MVDAALKSVYAGIAAGPEIPGTSIFVVPPRSDSTQLERRVIAIVLKRRNEI